MLPGVKNRRRKGRRSPALEQLLENDADSYEIVEVGDIQADDLLLSAEEHQAMLAQGEAPYNWRVRAVRCPERLNRKTGCGP
mgnify:CR=1 FL=1